MPNYHFNYTLQNGQQWDITFTAVRGHVMALEFHQDYKGWRTCQPRQLFDANIVKAVEQVRVGLSCSKTLAHVHVLNRQAVFLVR